ncbi:MAG: ZIP family metal transporter [Planctomycetota bacterium]
MDSFEFAFNAFIAGVVASLACGLGALPLLIRQLKIEERIGIGYGFAGGLMFAASVYNLLLPAIVQGTNDSAHLWPVLKILVGMLLGCALIWWIERVLTTERLQHSVLLKPFGSRIETLVFVAMFFHSVPEGVAVGVGYAAETHGDEFSGLGLYIALAIAIHNIPEGLAVALPMRTNGASISKCFWFAVLTSLPQPIAAVPASLLVWLFEPLVLPLLGFAAGAMMYLVIDELIPEALKSGSHTSITWAFMVGFSLMVLVQVVL